MTTNVNRDQTPGGSPAENFEETGDQQRERKQRWGDHEPGGAHMVPGGNPETKKEQESDDH